MTAFIKGGLMTQVMESSLGLVTEEQHFLCLGIN
ncbi:hypothetical protein Aazo_5169 ['Nostoc azollae' 0708]|uniref:Uncharacterized protein n=1 Tax=Nostoc azollae (strain 0708) TaxID=551115 RepID=D7E051_NOSA0|nr:hypothetical protein Aazo_5169 ['Nostoc azollae' 0708]